LNDFFKKRWTPVDTEVGNPKVYWDNLLHVTISKRAQLKAYFQVIVIFTNFNFPFQQQKDPLKDMHSDEFVKLALLTTTEDMANLNYPIHGFEQDEIAGIASVVATKDHYAKVTKDSPIYVLDCEMCVTEMGISELTRVTLVIVQMLSSLILLSD
jgi:RNA exonuclease 1